MAKKKTKIEDINDIKTEMLLHIICEACNKVKLPGNEILFVLLACMTEVAFTTMSVEYTDENFEEIAELTKRKLIEGLKHYRKMEEKENGKESK